MISEHILKITFLNKPELVFFFFGTRLNVKTDNSVQHVNKVK